LISYRNRFFLYSIHPAVKIFVFICWLKIILDINQHLATPPRNSHQNPSSNPTLDPRFRA
ncbi:MAG: hypothetical protein Q8887_02650, partial [Candidatus Phytoplasma australasiaticum]|nr:hypothetical protein [Candidatus Phytoplasma australasiaticum]